MYLFFSQVWLNIIGYKQLWDRILYWLMIAGIIIFCLPLIMLFFMILIIYKIIKWIEEILILILYSNLIFKFQNSMVIIIDKFLLYYNL